MPPARPGNGAVDDGNVPPRRNLSIFQKGGIGITDWFSSLYSNDSHIELGVGQTAWGDILLGILGAIAGDTIFTALGLVSVTGVNLSSIVVAAIGAIIVLIVYHAIRGKRATV